MQLHLLTAKKSYKECLQRLRRGEILAMIMDQNVRFEEGVFVDFFDKPACTTAGLAILSAQTGSPVVPLFIVRKPDTTYDMFIGEPIEAPPNRDPDTIRSFTQMYTKVIEDMIRKYPDQWIWIHRRWRTRLAKDNVKASTN
jgi:KDO2-lipid IV(A) lauroyltransferase